MDWAAFRREMPVTRRWAFLDHAAVAPLTARALNALSDWANDVAENGVANENTWRQRVEGVRRQAAHLLAADPQDVAFVKNTSEGVGIVAEGFPWRPGDNVVTSADEYPANVFPWRNLADRGVELRTVPSQEGRVELDDLRAAIDGRTRLLTLSFVEYASGFRNDLDAIGALCQQRGVAFFVDAIQGLGVLPLSVAQTPIDFLAADGHKWLLGPEGAAILFVRREWVDRLHPVSIGWNSVVDAFHFDSSAFRLKPNAGRWESGSLNVGGIAALGASLEMLLEAGIPAVSARVLELTGYLCERACAAGLGVFSSRRPGEASGIVSLILPVGADLRQLVARCRASGVIINRRAGRIRVSPHCYNTTDELDRLVDLLRAPLAS
jgi:selenocysteine lyase/cysteine desulfurase